MSFSKYLLVSLVIVFTLGCSNSDEEAGFGIRISPEANYFSREGGSIINFTFSAESREELRRYRVIETVDNKMVTTIKDTNVTGKFFTDWLDYVVPDSLGFGNHQIELLFGTIDVRGNEMKRAKVITVNIEERLLEEFGGNTMYSSLSNQFDAYDLLTGNPKYSSDTTAHIQDFTPANVSDSLGKTWTSPVPGIKFVKFNSFNYANATDVRVRTAFDTGVKNDTIRSLKADDILLTKIENNYIAIKLIFVTDLNGNANDKYIFSIKR
ncbi:MAG: hypothetical protein ACJAV5_001687 [Vicingaceae bacterium]|jgi:hypothetical protein